MMFRAVNLDPSAIGSSPDTNVRMDTDGSNAGSWKRDILAGAASGLQIWLVYGVVEFVLAYAIPVLFQPDVEFLPWQWRPIGLAFGMYVLLGVVLGSAGGALLAWTRRQWTSRLHIDHEIMAALTFTIAFAVNLIPARPLDTSEYIALAIALLLGASFAGALVWAAWLERTAFLANPWALSLLLLTWPWASHEGLGFHSNTVTTGAALGLFTVIIILAAMWHRFRSKRIGIVGRVAILSSVSILLLGTVLVSGTRHAVPAIQASEPSASAKCNVLLITMDTVRADHLSLYGYDRNTTPDLQDFARGATVYTRAVSAADMTLTSHASIFTGVYPSWHGAYYAPPEYPWGRPLASHYSTVAEVLRSNGYRTVAEVANYGALAPLMGMNKGFTVYDARRAVRVSELSWESRRAFFLREGVRRLLSLVMDTSVFHGRCLRAADINRHAFAFLEQSKNKGPFFLFLNYMDAHMAYLPPAPFNAKFPGRDPHFKVADYGNLVAVNNGRRHVTASERAHLVSQYDGGIAYMDSEIGKLVARLRELGLYENTLIIITSDHGEAFGERDLMEHAVGSVYQDQVHVPLLIKYPGQHAAQLSDVLVSHVDLLPTVLDLAGISLPSGVQGRSLRLPRTDDSDPVYSRATANPYLLALNRRFRGVRQAMFVGSWKVITWTDGPPELYDLATDPNETRNLYRTDDPRDAALAERLLAWAASAPRQFGRPNNPDRATVEKLKSLGYVQ